MEKTRPVTIRIPVNLYEYIHETADQEDRTVNLQITYFLKRGIEKYVKEKEKLGELVDESNKQTEGSAM